MTEVRMPQMGLTMTEGLISCWRKSEGDTICKGDILADIETDKIASELEAEADGILLKICAQEGEIVPVQGLLAILGQENEDVSNVSVTSEETELSDKETEKEILKEKEGKGEESKEDRVYISPLAKRTAAELDVPYKEVKGTGPNGRIVQDDILKAQEEKERTVRMAVSSDKGIPLSRVRKVIAKRMLQAHDEIPSVTLHAKADVTKLDAFRKELNLERAEKISWNDCILKITAQALMNNRKILDYIYGEEIVSCENVNLGVAVSAEEGLVVPVLHDAQKLSLSEVSRQMKELIAKSRQGALDLHELEGSNFTISNLGMYGVTYFTPIINQPNSAILGVGSIEEELYMEDNVVKMRKVLYLSLTFDHRVYDGDIAASFISDLKDGLQQPRKWII